MSDDVKLLNINSIYLSNGQNKSDWEFFFSDINNESTSPKIIALILKKLKEQPTNELTLDIIDYMIDFGNPNTVSLIANKEFLDNFLNLLKSETNAGVEIQKKVIFLSQKWTNKFSRDNTYPIFQENYNMLKGAGVLFPPEGFIIETYNKYVGNVNSVNNNVCNNESKSMLNDITPNDNRILSNYDINKLNIYNAGINNPKVKHFFYKN